MIKKDMSFLQAYLYATHYNDIIMPMMLTKVPVSKFVLASLLGCSYQDAIKIFDVAKENARLPATHIFLNQDRLYFHRSAAMKRQESRATHVSAYEESAARHDHPRKRG